MNLTYGQGGALVTGGSGGIGAAIVRRLAASGFPVATTHNRRSGGVPPGVASFPWSAPDAAAAADLAAAVERAIGPIRHLVACTGIAQDKAFFRMTEDEWLGLLTTNLTANVALCRAFVGPMMKAGFGRIVLVSSVSGQRGIPGHTVYAATKGGLDAFARSLAAECAAFGVTVNTVAPGFIETPMLDPLPPDKRRSLVAKIPMGRFGTPDDVAGTVSFLLSEQAAYVTGQTWAIDGGMSV